MKRLTALVSGKVQEVGYRARVVDIANAFGLRGMIENQKDGRVKIIAEGDDEKLKWFESAIDIKNTLISVSAIVKTYSPATGDFENFGKLVTKGETDSRLDTAAVYLKEIVVSLNKMNDNLGGKMDRMIARQDQTLDKQDQMLDKQDQMLDKQDELLGEARDINGKLDKVLDNHIIELKSDMNELKTALRAKGII
ncbi:MAG: acylphosphatase [Methanothrix sp.]|jgi:acylphosphatase|nr:acylphosphatase [Methanothrix sp.]